MSDCIRCGRHMLTQAQTTENLRTRLADAEASQAKWPLAADLTLRALALHVRIHLGWLQGLCWDCSGAYAKEAA